MLESGLLDSDVTVQRESIQVLGNLVTKANLARYMKDKTATIASPQTYPLFYDHSLVLLNHTDRDIRQGAVSVLASFYHPPRPGLEDALLTRFANEPSENVKAAIVRVLAQHARLGSIKSKQVIMAELQGASAPQIRTAAVFTMRLLKYDEALPMLVTLLTSTERPLRMAAAGALESYDSLSAGQVAQVAAAFKTEQDERVRASLGRVLSNAKK
jgi:HEAT repeat protein